MVINGVTGGSSSSYYGSSSSTYSNIFSGLEDILNAVGLSVGLFIIIAIIIDIVFLVIVGNIAKDKGLNTALCVILALIFGLPVLIVILCLPNYQHTTVIYKEDSGKSGYSLTGGSKKYYSQSKTQEEIWICPKCGEQNNKNAQYCINCYTKKP